MLKLSPLSVAQIPFHLCKVLVFSSLALLGCEGVLSGASKSNASGDGSSGAREQGLPSGGTQEPVAVLLPQGEGLHRLNRLEYNNTVFDLLGVDLRPADTFPHDAALGGFDNIAEGLTLSPTLFDLYADAARSLAEAALRRPPLFSHDWDLPSGAPEGISVGPDAWALHGHDWSAGLDIPEQAQYTLRFKLSGTQTGAAPRPSFALSIDGESLEQGDVTGTPTAPQDLVFERALAPGVHTVMLRATNFINIAVENTNNEVILHKAHLVSVAQSEPAAQGHLFDCVPEAPGCHKSSLLRFAERAFRRPLSVLELGQLEGLWSQLSDLETENAALQLGLRAVLTSPQFLYRALRIEDAPQGSFLGDYYLASRLSYFLWSTMPDQELFDAAASGELQTDAGLVAQVQRMIASPRSRGLVDGFASQWLGTRLLEGAAPAPEVFPKFTEGLRAELISESHLFFQEVLSAQVPLVDLPSPGFGFLNDHLADHYDVARPGTTDFVRVSLGSEERQGLLELGAWLTAQSEAEGTSPIRRGRWFLEQMVCSPVPPPPASVVAELPGTADLPVRERLALHRTDPSCAGCHELLDPVGLGFEVFDGIGAPRDAAVDSSGQLPSGAAFSGPRELALALLEEDQISHCVTEKLTTYALSRRLAKREAPLISEIWQSAGGRAATMASLITAIVTSSEFRRGPTEWDFESN